MRVSPAYYCNRNTIILLRLLRIGWVAHIRLMLMMAVLPLGQRHEWMLFAIWRCLWTVKLLAVANKYVWRQSNNNNCPPAHTWSQCAVNLSIIYVYSRDTIGGLHEEESLNVVADERTMKQRRNSTHDIHRKGCIPLISFAITKRQLGRTYKVLVVAYFVSRTPLECR